MRNKKIAFAAISVVAASIIVAGVWPRGGSALARSAADAVMPTSPPAQIGPVVEMPQPEPLAQWAPDGVISTGEYDHQASFGNMQIYWTNYYQFFYGAMRIRADGWMALAIPPPDGGGNTDIIYGSVIGGVVTVSDMFSAGGFGGRQLDTAAGGQDNVTLWGGAVTSGYRMVEFRRALATADSHDNAFDFPLTRIMWAYGSGETVTEQGEAEIALLFFPCPEYIC